MSQSCAQCGTFTADECYIYYKKPTGLNGHTSISDFTPTSCQKDSYLYINSPIIECMKINDGIGKQDHNPRTQQQSMCCILIEKKIIPGIYSLK